MQKIWTKVGLFILSKKPFSFNYSHRKNDYNIQTLCVNIFQELILIIFNVKKNYESSFYN